MTKTVVKVGYLNELLWLGHKEVERGLVDNFEMFDHSVIVMYLLLSRGMMYTQQTNTYYKNTRNSW